VHFLSPEEQLPPAALRAYEEAESLLMEIDMDDLDAAQMQQATFELGVLPPDESLEQQLGPETYARVAAKAREIGVDPNVLNRLRPWLAGVTLVQIHLVRMGLDPSSGVEQRLTARAIKDGKPIEGIETLREQLNMLAALPDAQQQEFLMYSVDDVDRAAREVDAMLAAWRNGDAQALAELLSEGFEKYPDLYRPLTTERNRRWTPTIEGLLDDEQDYLVVVGALHLVGEDSVIDLLQRKGYSVRQH